MDEIKDRYYELDELITTINILTKTLKDKEIIGKLKSIKDEYKDEKESLEERISELEKKEKKEQELEYEGSRY